MSRFDFFDYLNKFGIDASLFPSAVIGALLSLRKNNKLGLFGNLTTVGFGFCCSVFLTPIIVELLSVDSNLKYSVGFIVGYGGLHILERFLFLMINVFKRK